MTADARKWDAIQVGERMILCRLIGLDESFSFLEPPGSSRVKEFDQETWEEVCRGMEDLRILIRRIWG